MVPRTYHADGMVLFCDPMDRPLLAAVLEVQRGRDLAKQRTWKLYVAQLEAELDVDTALVIFCPGPATARWYRRLLPSDGPSGLLLQPLIFTPGDVPLVVDVERARANPALVVLSALCHGGSPEVDTAFPALLEALRSVGPKKEILYYDVVLAGLPGAARARREAFMTTTADYEYRSELFRNIAARRDGDAVLTVLDTRGVPVPEAVREKILACTEQAQLKLWLRRAVTAATAADVVNE
ncbi:MULTISPECIES: hypothetical protein [Protofrankia]|uniref:Uncharacterized protein n=1 Tax=Protofrankia coriariae TaxID=1562887 RepID=A0ABR5F0V2_9ACTN|nr:MULTISPECIES: hypothetical protein [Protofrankia]KLL10295.1 hypothetical protein FrCorBMG51_19145 [Protofrankia coriariae]ONH32733.1 hypothetical protein BL254_21160 [Protofrankia sp. BMG5.30]